MSLKGKHLVIPAFLAGFACAAMLATIPDSRAEDSCLNTPLTVLSSAPMPNPLKSTVNYLVTYNMPGCLWDQGYKITSVTKETNYTIRIDYGK